MFSRGRALADWLMRLVHDHKGLGWLGLNVTIVGLIVVPFYPAFSTYVQTLLVLGWVVAAVFAITLSAVIRQEHTIRGLECMKVYELKGERGREAVVSETMLLRFKERTEAFPYSSLIATGDLEDERVEYRVRNSRRRARSTFTLLGPEHVLRSRSSISPADDIMIRPPAPIKKRQLVEIKKVQRFYDCFPEVEEGVTKSILFPVKRLKMELRFYGCMPTNVSGTIHNGDVTNSFRSLKVEELSDDGYVVKWEEAGAQPGSQYRIRWKWLH